MSSARNPRLPPHHQLGMKEAPLGPKPSAVCVACVLWWGLGLSREAFCGVISVLKTLRRVKNYGISSQSADTICN